MLQSVAVRKRVHMLLCAHHVLPITSDPIVDGAILVRDGLIADIGPADLLKKHYPDEEAKDYGEAALIPGLVDLHAHLEDTLMRGLVPDQPYAQWRHAVHALGDGLDRMEWRASAVLGALEALSSGITFVADRSRAGATVAALQRLGMRGIVYREVGATDSRRIDYALDAALDSTLLWREGIDNDRIKIGIAPRPTYDCHPALYTKAAALAREEGIPLSLSVASSQEECDFIRYGSSSLSVDAMKDKRGFVEIPPWLPTGVSPVQYIANWGGFEADNILAVHCVHVDAEDIGILKRYGVSVAVCARTNAQLSMGVAPLLEMIRAGLTVGLGTGYSEATDATDLLEEMRTCMLLQRAVNPGRYIDCTTMLEMATINAARAVKMDDKIGSLEAGKLADIIAVDLSASYQSPTDDPASAIVNTASGPNVIMTMIGGEIRYEQGNWTAESDISKDLSRALEIRAKLRK